MDLGVHLSLEHSPPRPPFTVHVGPEAWNLLGTFRDHPPVPAPVHRSFHPPRSLIHTRTPAGMNSCLCGCFQSTPSRLLLLTPESLCKTETMEESTSKCSCEDEGVDVCEAPRMPVCLPRDSRVKSPGETREPRTGEERSEAKKRRGFPRLTARRQQSQEANLGLFSLISQFSTSC